MATPVDGERGRRVGREITHPRQRTVWSDLLSAVRHPGSARVAVTGTSVSVPVVPPMPRIPKRLRPERRSRRARQGSGRLARQVERRWADACEDARLGRSVDGSWAAPKLTNGRAAEIGSGWVWTVGAPRGGTIEDIDMAGHVLAPALGVHSVTAAPGGEPSSGVLSVQFRAPFGGPSRWRPPAGREVVVAHTSTGQPVTVELGGQVHVLVGGTTGSGKSTFLRGVVASAVAAKGVAVVGIDEKMVELGPWAHAMAGIATDPAETAALLESMVVEMRRRYTALRDAGVMSLGELCEARGVEWVEDMPWVVMVIDEVALLTGRGREAEFGRVVELSKLARAAGIQLWVATQQPLVTVLPSDLRGNLLLRWCGLTDGAKATEIVLGSADMAKRAKAHLLPRDSGQAYWRDGSELWHVRGPWLEGPQIREVVEGAVERGLVPEWRVGDGPEPAAADPAEPSPKAKGGQWPWVPAPDGWPGKTDKRGRVRANRATAFEVFGSRPPCAGCGEVLDWEQRVVVTVADPDLGLDAGNVRVSHARKSCR